MNKAIEILKIELDPDHKQFGKLLSIQASLTGSLLTATARVRANDLRDQDDDGIDAFLATVRLEDDDDDDYASLLN